MSSDETINPISPASEHSDKKVLHFSDGAMELEETPEEPKTSVVVNPKELKWAPWMWHQTYKAGSTAVKVCDYLGESLASFFGITTPKYQFEIDEFHRQKKKEEEERKEDLELGGWTNSSETTISTAPEKLNANTPANNPDNEKY